MSGIWLDASAIHSAVTGKWTTILMHCGIDERYLCNRAGPCPKCGGKDRFRFDDKNGRGTWICNRCGAGDGFNLLQLVNGWSFSRARSAVIESMGLRQIPSPIQSPRRRPQIEDHTLARPTARVLDLLRKSVPPESVRDAGEYLAARGLWPLPDECIWRAHEGIDYWDGQVRLGRHPALIAEVQDAEGELVTAHVTYLHGGRKLDSHAPRKLLSALNGRRGCAVRLMPLDGEVLGIAEGIETALAAQYLHGVPVWSALNTALLAKFIPPPRVRQLIIFADRDEAGQNAAYRLQDSLDGKCRVELCLPSEHHKDWADVLKEKRQ